MPKTTSELDLRASLILKLVVERFLVAGDAVGSRTLAELPGMRMSPATIRSVLADLESAGLLASAHTSAGRMPTPEGLRVFLERIFVPAPLDTEAELALHRQLQDALRRGGEAGKVAAQTLADFSQVAAIVTLPSRRRRILRQIEFIRLRPNRVLSVLVFEPGEVENRIFDLDQDISLGRLQDIARQLSERFAGLPLEAIHQRLQQDLRQARQELHSTLHGVAALFGELSDSAPQLRVAGSRKLVEHEELASPDKLRRLFAMFDEQSQWLSLFEHCMRAGDMRIFLGKDSGVDVLSGCGIVTVPYAVNGQQVGVVGVVGPMRMNYSTTIPLVRATAEALAAHLNPGQSRPI